MSGTGRRIHLVNHEQVPPAVAETAESLTRQLAAHEITVVPEDHPDGARDCELVVVLGGDGTILRAAEQARLHDVPLLGVNLGHVGFLAEAEPEALPEIVARIVAGTYTVEERMTLDVTVATPDGVVSHGWALNETAINKGSATSMIDATVAVDELGLSSYGCDGLLVATPTGSTAYAFSAGGPVMWPEVEAMLMVPLAAHALFARPVVISPTSTISVVIGTRHGDDAEVWFDGRRHVRIPDGTRVQVTGGARPLRLARLAEAAFTSRLVAKFDLPTESWRDRSRGER